ncbi:hypothetical protein M0R45_001449 [Rubus argutus]|uniref:Uncharacterized protein n=1 Tax=Rubus argutus TaxID=59490 RepID=A0AAW1VMC6_RUBAR
MRVFLQRCALVREWPPRLQLKFAGSVNESMAKSIDSPIRKFGVHVEEEYVLLHLHEAFNRVFASMHIINHKFSAFGEISKEAVEWRGLFISNTLGIVSSLISNIEVI